MRTMVYGLGKLGLPLASVLIRDGQMVRGWDADPERVNWCIEQQRMERAHGVSTITEPDVLVDGIIFAREPEPASLNFIVVPTPSLDTGEFDSYMVEEATRTIYEINKNHTTAVITSTVFPGTCDRLYDRYGDKITLVYNPTFIALGSVIENLLYPNLLLFGVNEEDDVSLVEDVWNTVLNHLNRRPHTHIGPFVEAELLKLSINCALATKISLANELGHLFQSYGVDPAQVSEIGADPRIGPAFMMPGVPISGPCLPRDNKALQLAAARSHIRLSISEATDDVDFELRTRLYNDITDETVQNAKPDRPGSVGILGISYKYGVPLSAGSVGSWLLDRLNAEGYDVAFYDEQLGGDQLDDVLSKDVVVVCHKELTRLAERAKGGVIHVWA